MFINEAEMSKAVFDAEMAKVYSIVDRINAGQCKEFKIARYLKEYPSMLYLDGRGGTFSICGVESITEADNSTEIVYDTARGRKNLKLTFK